MPPLGRVWQSGYWRSPTRCAEEARATGEPLLFKDEDFVQADLTAIQVTI
jgi:hypothetical protein